MFTGIIKSVGEVKDIIKDDEILKIKISSSENIFNSTQIGDSVSVNGTCLTAVEKNIQNHIISFDVVGETISKTNLDYLQNNEKVNLETPLKIIDGLDGHIVQGHVDTTALILRNEQVKDNWLLKVKIDKKWLKYCILKGSIAIDGISLTIADINENYDNNYGSISVSIIPHTLENTNLKFKKCNDKVNIETDFFAKYIEKLLPKKD
tara:strand:- start:2020 stop:2640 length:621 start_codon:yes stop_codon:yes gene_type:complete